MIVSTACTGDVDAADPPGLGTGIPVDTLPSPGENITGLAWGGGWLWAVDGTSGTVFRMDTVTGEVTGSFPCQPPSSSYRTTGLAYSSYTGTVLVGLWDYGYNGYVYQYSPSGDYQGSMSMCGG